MIALIALIAFFVSLQARNRETKLSSHMYREPNLRLGSNDDTCLVFFASYEKHALSIYIFSIFKP